NPHGRLLRHPADGPPRRDERGVHLPHGAEGTCRRDDRRSLAPLQRAAPHAAAEALPYGQPPAPAVPGDHRVSEALPDRTAKAGPNTILTIVDTRLYVGTISGTSVDTLTVTVDASGGFGFHGTSLCSCAIAGHPGTVVMTINGKGEPDGTFADRRETLAASAT